MRGPHQEPGKEAEQGDAERAPDGRAAQIRALGRALLALVEQAPHAECDGRADRQAGVRARCLPGRPVREPASRGVWALGKGTGSSPAMTPTQHLYVSCC